MFYYKKSCSKRHNLCQIVTFRTCRTYNNGLQLITLVPNSFKYLPSKTKEQDFSQYFFLSITTS